MSSPRSDFRAGLRVTAPIVLGIVPFGLVAGAAAVSVGIPALQALAMSVVIFAGASQLAAVELVGQGAPAVVVVATVLVVNLRLVMYSASIAPHFANQSAKWKAALSYLLTDQAYAVSVVEFENDPKTSRRWYYLGVAVPLWVAWQAATVVGVFVGASVPDGWQLEFAVPLVFLAILVPAVTDRATGAAAIVGGTAAILARGLPYNLGLVVAALIAIAAGLAVESLTDVEPGGEAGAEDGAEVEAKSKTEPGADDEEVA
ncbi:AzlC family ABC transporter permease [Halorussus litoreus]|uniref:AzlC family ABC transporter permease n=1 Tax=Halorussus litoreus TaxID=1710536 RepID=UPI000E244952|nr:AzlC family ABC transporter permease [Halorussus litoreus]